MDGNGRWAKRRHLPRFAGHRVGRESVRSVVTASLDMGIEALTLFAFSSENWRRPQEEVGLLLRLFLSTLGSEVKKLHENGIRLRVIGQTEVFEPLLRERIAQAEALTADNRAMTLAVAANYGGRWDVTEACRRLAREVAAGRLGVEQITEAQVQAQISLADLPEPDLFIRTGGEMRISNFLNWQLAYTELYFTPILWPDFRESAYREALHEYSRRQRRFGRTGEQVTSPSEADR